MLSVQDVVVRFGGVVALDGPTFEVHAGEICGLIGPNGAGKTTLFNCISRLADPDEGSIRFEDDDLLAHAPHEIAPLGIARTFQNLGLAHSLTVRENVMLGAHHTCGHSFLAGGLGLPSVRRAERELRERADEVMARLELSVVADRPAFGLPYGTLKRVELARALCTRPKLLLLDEPAGGLSHGEVETLADLLLALRDEHGLTILLVEHAMGMVMRISDHVVVLDFGREIADGKPAEVQEDPQVIEAYLGGSRMSLLAVEGLEAGYGPVTVVRDLSFTVDEGKVVTILGANGAGKTTTLRALSGVARARGRITFDGSQLVGRSPEWIVRRGLAHVPEGRGNFASLTVEENLRLGAYVRKDGAKVREDMQRCFGYFPRLEERRTQAAGSLSGGEQQMLAVARGLMLRPKLMLLDEPSHGLSPLITREVFKILREVAEEGTTLLIVEQNANLVLDFADHAYVLETGKLVLDGSAEEIGADEGVRRSYLGMV